MKTRVVGSKLSRNLVDSSFSADQIDRWIEAVSSEIGGVSWRHVGWTPSMPNINNAGICEVANDKRAPIAEVIFNSIDAVIELAHATEGLDNSVGPHAAVASCKPFASGNWLHGRISATLRDSGDPSRPTLDIRDLGCGQHPDRWTDSFLSLHSATKSSKPYLCGKFGMGLKSAFKFCPRFVLASRLHESLLGGGEDEVGVTVVRRNYTKGDKAPRYEYLCDADGNVIRLDLPEFDAGTLVRLAEYDLDGYNGGISTPNNSLYALLNSYLIDPPVRLTMHDRRGLSRENRKFNGLVHSLENPKTPNSHEERFAVNVDFDGEESRVMVRYYVLHAKESPHDKSGTKVKAEQGITFSHNGQRHGVESRIIFKSRFGLGAIYKRLAVVVDTSGLQPAACSDLFSSNRIAVNPDSAVYKTIMESLQAHMNGDEELQTLADEAASRRDEDRAAQTESLEKAVADIVVDILGRRNVVFRRGGPGVAKGGGGRPRRNRDDSKLPALPTRVLIDNQPLVAPRGRFAYLTLDIDAKNGYVTPDDGKVSVAFKNGKTARVGSQGELIGGKLRLTVTIPASAPKGDSGFTVTLDDPDNGIKLSAKGTIRIVDPKKGKAGGGNKNSEGDTAKPGAPNTIVNWLFRREWEGTNDEAWNENFPGECIVRRRNGAVESIVFNLNADFAPVEAIRNRIGKKKTRAYDERLDRYAKTLCKALLHKELNEMSPEASFSTAIVDSAFDGISLEDDDIDLEDEVVVKGRSIPAPGKGLLGHATFLAESAAKT